MDERPSLGFWIAGTFFLLVLLSCPLLSAMIALGGGNYVMGGILFLAVVLREYGPHIAGAFAAAGMILLAVRLANRRRDRF